VVFIRNARAFYEYFDKHVAFFNHSWQKHELFADIGSLVWQQGSSVFVMKSTHFVHLSLS
jgi:hypothetical protein